jgi:hypothetical protein
VQLTKVLKAWRPLLSDAAFEVFVMQVALKLEQAIVDEVRKAKVTLLGGLLLDKLQR